MSNVIVIAPPSATLVSVAEVKAHLRVDHDDDDARLQELLWAAQNEFCGTDGEINRSIGVQTLELQLTHFPCFDDIALPCPPLLQDDEHPLSVKYVDDAGGVQTVDPATYTVMQSGKAGRAIIVLASGAAWPSPRWQRDAVRIRFSSGYPANDVRAAGLKEAIKLHVEMNYDGGDADRMRRAIAGLLRPYVVY